MFTIALRNWRIARRGFSNDEFWPWPMRLSEAWRKPAATELMGCS